MRGAGECWEILDDVIGQDRTGQDRELGQGCQSRRQGQNPGLELNPIPGSKTNPMSGVSYFMELRGTSVGTTAFGLDRPSRRSLECVHGG